MKYTRMAMPLPPTATSLAHAQSAGQRVVNTGWVHLIPQDFSRPLTVYALGQSVEVSGSGLALANANTFTFTTQYFVTDHVALETVLGAPSKLHLSGTGSLAPADELDIARAQNLVMQVQYHFGEPNACMRSYLGMGLGHVRYRDIEPGRPSAIGQILVSPTTGSMLIGPTTALLSKLLAFIVSAGLTYSLDTHRSIDAPVSYMWLSAKVTLTMQTLVGTVITTTEVRINLLASFLSVGYRFQRSCACSDANHAIVQLEDGDGVARCTDPLGRGACRRRGLFRHRRVLLRDSFDLVHCDVDLLDTGILPGGDRRNLSRQFSRRSSRSSWRFTVLLRPAGTQTHDARS